MTERARHIPFSRDDATPLFSFPFPLSRQRLGQGPARLPPRKQATAEESALQGPVAMDSAAAKAGHLPGRIQTRHRIARGIQHPAGQVRLESAQGFSGEYV